MPLERQALLLLEQRALPQLEQRALLPPEQLALLPPERQPLYGITDWLVEDLVDQGDALLDAMIATSDLSRDGQIYAVPAHGADPGEYIAKLGRVWMPKVHSDGRRESWSMRLQRLLQTLEALGRAQAVAVAAEGEVAWRG